MNLFDSLNRPLSPYVSQISKLPKSGPELDGPGKYFVEKNRLKRPVQKERLKKMVNEACLQPAPVREF